MISNNIGIKYLDVNTLYRAIALKAIRDKINFCSEENIKKFMKNINIRVCYICIEQKIYLEEKNVIEYIKNTLIST